MTLRKQPFENFVGKEENAGNLLTTVNPNY